MNGCNESGRNDQTHPRQRCQRSTGFVYPTGSNQFALDRGSLNSASGIDHICDVFAKSKCADGSDNAIFPQAAANLMNQRGALRYEPIACAIDQLQVLLLCRFCWRKAKCGAERYLINGINCDIFRAPSSGSTQQSPRRKIAAVHHADAWRLLSALSRRSTFGC